MPHIPNLNYSYITTYFFMQSHTAIEYSSGSTQDHLKLLHTLWEGSVDFILAHYLIKSSETVFLHGYIIHMYLQNSLFRVAFVLGSYFKTYIYNDIEGLPYVFPDYNLYDTCIKRILAYGNLPTLFPVF